MRAKAIGNCNCNASSRAHCACVCACMCAALHWYWGEWPCMTQIKVTALANKGDKWLLTHSIAHSLTHSLSHSLTRWRRRHCAKTKLQQKAQRALKMRPSAMNSIQHTHTHTNTRTHTHTHTHTIMTGCRERGRDAERCCGAALHCSRTSCDADVAMRNLREILQESLNSRRVSVI